MSIARSPEKSRDHGNGRDEGRHTNGCGLDGGFGSQRIRVFLADEEPFLRRGLRAVVEREPDMEVCGETGGNERILAELRRAAPDVVVMELYLQDRETISLIKQLRAAARTTQIVVLSRHDELVYAVPAFKAGARAFVMKHEDPRAVIAAIREVHQGKPCFSWEVNSLLLSRLSGGRTNSREVGAVVLSPRELEVVTLIAAGHSSREIANRLKVSIKTVEAHRAHIKQKANVDNSAALIRFSMSVASERSLVAV